MSMKQGKKKITVIKQPKVLHRQATGYKGSTVMEGARTTIYLPNHYMDKLRHYCALQGVSMSEWLRTVVCGTLDSATYEKHLDKITKEGE